MRELIAVLKDKAKMMPISKLQKKIVILLLEKYLLFSDRRRIQGITAIRLAIKRPSQTARVWLTSATKTVDNKTVNIKITAVIL